MEVLILIGWILAIFFLFALFINPNLFPIFALILGITALLMRSAKKTKEAEKKEKELQILKERAARNEEEIKQLKEQIKSTDKTEETSKPEKTDKDPDSFNPQPNNSDEKDGQ